MSTWFMWLTVFLFFSSRRTEATLLHLMWDLRWNFWDDMKEMFDMNPFFWIPGCTEECECACSQVSQHLIHEFLERNVGQHLQDPILPFNAPLKKLPQSGVSHVTVVLFYQEESQQVGLKEDMCEKTAKEGKISFQRNVLYHYLSWISLHTLSRLPFTHLQPLCPWCFQSACRFFLLFLSCPLLHSFAHYSVHC